MSIIDTVCGIYVFSYFYYISITTERKLSYAVWSYLFMGLILCGNGLIEFVTDRNIIDQYVQSISPDGFFSENKMIRYGIGTRVRSFIPHSNSYGVACLILLFIVAYFYIVDKKKLIPMGFTYIISALALFGVVTSGSRTPIFAMVPMVFFINNPWQLIKKHCVKVISLSVLAYVLLFDYVLKIFQSVFSASETANVEGSSTEMRANQLVISLMMMSKNPWFGNGMHYEMREYSDEIFGAESVWFPLLAKNGLWGTISYAILYLGLFYACSKMKYKKLYFAFILSWLMARTLTSFVGVTDSLFFTVFALLLKGEEFCTKRISKL